MRSLSCLALALGPALVSAAAVQARASPNVQQPLKVSSSFDCLPSQPCWPSPDDWHSFNASINGRLRATEILAKPCYDNPSSEACAIAIEQYGDAFARENVYGAMQNLKWEACGSDSCQLNSLSPESGISGNCSLGRISPLYVNCSSDEDAAATIKFVRKHGIRLSIKNSGHDYFGRSSAANSLALWTHHMKNLEFHEEFTLTNCPSQPKLTNIGVMGAGIKAAEAFTYFEKHGMQITVGAAPSVGVSGGFGQAGGHGPLAPTYGLMVDQAVEFDIVDAFGRARTINKCNDPDLFWAMRGGGGSTFAVLTSYKLQLHSALPINVHVVQASIALNSSSASDVTKSQSHRDIVFALAQNQPQWSKAGIAGYNFFFPDEFISILVLPSSSKSTLMSLTSQWRDLLTVHPGLQVAANTYLTFHNYTSFATWTQSPEFAENGLIGVGIAESSRLIPRPHFSSYYDINRLVDAFLEGLQISFSRAKANLAAGVGHIYATTPANTPDVDRQTSVTPAWRDSLWHVVYPALYLNNATKTDQDGMFDMVGKAVQPLKDLTPGSGAYFNEGDWMEEEWQDTFFGGKANYERLLAVKRRFDPEGLFRCWKCVGWEAHNDPIESCYDTSKD